MFAFKDLDYLTDYEIDLKIKDKLPTNDEKGYVPTYLYWITLHNSYDTIGLIDIRIGYNEGLYYGGHIGYTIFESYRGHHYAYKACNLIKEVAIKHQMEYLYITCNPDNIPSRKTCEKLGLNLIEIVNLPTNNDMYLDGDRQKCIYEWIIE